MLGNDVVDLRDADSRPESFRPRFDARVFLPEEQRAIACDRDPLARRWAHWAAKEAAFKLAKQLDPSFVFAPGRLRVRFDPKVQRAGRRVERVGEVEGIGASRLESLVTIEVKSFETIESVHVVALPAGADWGAVRFSVESIELSTDPSVAVRRLAIREIARSLGVAADRLSIGLKRRDGSTSSAAGVHGSMGPGVSGGAGDVLDPGDALNPGDAVDPVDCTTTDRIRGRIPSVELDGVETSLALSLSHHGRWIAFAMTPQVEIANAEIERRRVGAAVRRAGATTR